MYVLKCIYWRVEIVLGVWFCCVVIQLEYDFFEFLVVILQYFFENGEEEELKFVFYGNRKNDS